MPGRKYTQGASTYRYSINGQEKESELNENITSAEFWMYDSRLGRRWNIDPINAGGTSGYSVFGNNPLFYTDPNGLDTVSSQNKANVGDVLKHRNGKSNFFWNKVKNGNGVESYEGGGESAQLQEVVVRTKGKKRSLANSAFSWANDAVSANSKEWGGQRSDYYQARSNGLSQNQIAAYGNIPQDRFGVFEKGWQAEQDYRTAQLWVGGAFLAPFAVESGAVSYILPRFGETAFGGMAADAANQIIFQGRNIYNYQFGSTLTAGFLGGRNLVLSAVWQASGSLFDISLNGAMHGTLFHVTNSSFNSFKAAFVGNLVAGGSTVFFKSLGGFTTEGLKTSGGAVKFLFQTVDGNNGLFGGIISNKIEENLNK